MILSNLPVLSTLDSIKSFWLKWFQKTIVYVERSVWGLRSHVDDILLTRNNLEMIKATKK